jgi:large subunit ribosomal protein L30e
MIDFERIIKSAKKSGKIVLGSKKAMEGAKKGRAVAIIVASNYPTQFLVQLKNYATISKIPIYVYPSNSSDLGTVCGKPFPVSAVTIRHTVDPELITMMKG